MPTKTIQLDTSTANFLKFDTATLVIDESNNRVGIGTISPEKELHVIGDIKTVHTTNSSSAISLIPGSATKTGTINIGSSGSAIQVNTADTLS